VPAVSSSLIDPDWEQFQALIPSTVDEYPLGCHRSRVSDRVVFNRLVQVLVCGIAYVEIADSGCPVTMIQTRRDEWIAAGIFTELEQICPDADYDSGKTRDLPDTLGCDGVISARGIPLQAGARRVIERTNS